MECFLRKSTVRKRRLDSPNAIVTREHESSSSVNEEQMGATDKVAPIFAVRAIGTIKDDAKTQLPILDHQLLSYVSPHVCDKDKDHVYHHSKRWKYYTRYDDTHKVFGF